MNTSPVAIHFSVVMRWSCHQSWGNIEKKSWGNSYLSSSSPDEEKKAFLIRLKQIFPQSAVIATSASWWFIGSLASSPHSYLPVPSKVQETESNCFSEGVWASFQWGAEGDQWGIKISSREHLSSSPVLWQHRKGWLMSSGSLPNITHQVIPVICGTDPPA